MYQEALEEYRRGGSIGDSPRALIGYAYARAGMKAEAQEYLKETLDKANKDASMFYFAALIYSVLEEKDRAFECLQKLYEARDDRILSIKGSIELESLKVDPRFRELLHRINLTD